MTIPVIYLHIGTNKTGTSAIQQLLNRKREELKEFGLLYPAAGCRGEAHYGLSDSLGFVHGPPADTAGEKLSLRQALEKEVRFSQARSVVFSSENFVLRRAIQPVFDFFAPYEVRVIVYLRRHDGWWESAYCQAVKMVADPPWGRNLEAYIRYQKRKNPKYGDYRDLLDRWAQVFGKERIVVRPYERQQNQPDIAADFLRAIGEGRLAESFGLRSERVNESTSFEALNLVDTYQRARIEPALRARLIKYVLGLPKKADGSSLASPELRRRLVDENAADYAYIAREYLGREDGRLFLDPLPDPKEPWLAPKQPSRVSIVEETLKALAM